MPQATKPKDFPQGDLLDIVIKYFECQELNDPAAVQELVNHNFVFSSSDEESFDRETYFARCWPTDAEIGHQVRITRFFEYYNEVFVLYQRRSASSKPVKMAKIFRFEGSKIKEVKVCHRPFSEAA